ncbi:MAG: antibiotic biosynthesis monooxygenase [Planctomycetes bacterium]|nr:antibiotic biosynthesis monooxygenase [Planctomycetota bacterium]
MIVAVSRFSVPREQAEALAARFRGRGRRVDGHPGFLGLEVLRGQGPTPEFLLVTRWADRAALKAYLRSEDFRLAHAEGEELGAEFATFEVVAT